MTLKHQFWVVGPAFAPEPMLIKFAPTLTTHLASGHGDVPVPPPASRVQAMIGQIIAIKPEDRKAHKSEGSKVSLESEVKVRLEEVIAAEKQRWVEDGVRQGIALGLKRAKEAIDSAALALSVKPVPVSKKTSRPTIPLADQDDAILVGVVGVNR